MRCSLLYLGAPITSPHSSILLPTKLSSVSIETLFSNYYQEFTTKVLVSSQYKQNFRGCSSYVSNLKLCDEIIVHIIQFFRIRDHRCRRSHLNCPEVHFDK
jgi:hypothetical protein